MRATEPHRLSGKAQGIGRGPAEPNELRHQRRDLSELTRQIGDKMAGLMVAIIEWENENESK